MLEINKIYNMDCLEGLKKIEDNSIDSIVTDPPYELGFMGKSWDKSGIAYNIDVWKECLRVLKPGGHLLAFGGSRTYHRLACAIEDAGFEIRDQIQWIYGSGFPKSTNISKQIDKLNSKTNEYIKILKDELRNVFIKSGLTLKELNEKCGFEASRYLRKSSTWETVLPTVDKWIIMRNVIGCDDDFSELFKEAERKIIGKQLWTNSKHHFISGEKHNERVQLNITEPATPEAQQWEGWGTALKPAHEPIVVARKPLSEKTVALNVLKWGTGGLNIGGCRIGTDKIIIRGGGAKYYDSYKSGVPNHEINQERQGRFPANIIFDEEAGKMLDKQSGTSKSTGGTGEKSRQWDNGIIRWKGKATGGFGDVGGASRFFYCPKASKKERGEYNNHPTVKPIKLIEYLIKLVTPPQGIVLDPFIGSGTTAIACLNQNFKYIGFELEPTYCEIANKRIQNIIQ